MWLNILFLLILLLVFTPASILLYGVTRWQMDTQRRRGALEGRRARLHPSHFDSGQLRDLPPPVARYLVAVLREGQPLIAAVELSQRGTLRRERAGARWRTFNATQTTIVEHPGFDWDARLDLGPVPGVQWFAQEGYDARGGLQQARLFGLIPLGRAPEPEALAPAQLIRFLAEAPWYPTRLLPGLGLSWQALDETSARATLRDGAREVSLIFRFDAAGLVSEVSAEARQWSDGRSLHSAPWSLRFSRYEVRGDMRVPLQAEAAWESAGARDPYWRAEVTDILYKFAG